MVIGISTAGARQQPLQPWYNLAALLEVGEGGIADCLTAFLELRSCTNEIILFFLNGKPYLGFDCFRAIHIITRQFWPSMLTSLGCTAEARGGRRTPRLLRRNLSSPNSASGVAGAIST
uniref:Prolamin-like domain-containing protein n=1 Tax=Nelumbo nucifera TaxID=4432 RepID=A0A822XHB7_NELNU|nr:TPA_asm: hypothetical protein HUJ06_019688 [Nelumbo nucifera]